MTRSAEQQLTPAFEEFDVVRTRVTISDDGYVYPSGSIGAVVLVHRDGKAFEVELPQPRPLVVTLETDEIELAR